MSAIPKLMLVPLSDGYRFNLGHGVTSTDASIGMPLQRINGRSDVHTLSVSYLVTKDQRDYLLSFLRVYESLPFLAQLIIHGSDLKWYECRIVDNDISVSAYGVQASNVTLSLVAEPAEQPLREGMTLSAVYQMSAPQNATYYQRLAKSIDETLLKLMLIPLRDGYGMSLGRMTLNNETESKTVRQRKDSVGKIHSVTPTYRCTKAQYDYLITFLESSRSKRFLAYLLVDNSQLAWYECRIIDSMISVSTISNTVFDVQLTLAVDPHIYDFGLDNAITDVYEMTGGQSDAYFRSLERLVNNLPETTR